MIKKVLIANRGEIALRVHRACHDMGIATVAVHSTADKDAMHVYLADESVCIGPPAAKDSYLDMPAIISAALITQADAIHPGFGFLSENARFARMVEDHGLIFIGPEAQHIDLMGNKIAAKEMAKKLNLSPVPGSKGRMDSLAEAKKIADEIGYPVLVKAAAGGGGRGMKLSESAKDLESVIHMCQQEAQAAFGDSTVYMEKYLLGPRHIEVQIMGDGRGNAVHFWERDCSIQRRHQKIIEEAPSPALTMKQRTTICEKVQKAIAEMKYRGAGTVEFLYENGEFYFIEMNTRIQVEHPVSEAICDTDLLCTQIRMAAGEKLDRVVPDIRGHAIECRINAEDPESFAPMPGTVDQIHIPGGPGIRIDSGLYAGYKIPPFYDSMIAKLIVHGSDRHECLRRLTRALEEFVISGVSNTIPFHIRLLQMPDFLEGNYNIHWLEKMLAEEKS